MPNPPPAPLVKYVTDAVWIDDPVKAVMSVGRKEIYLAEDVERVLIGVKAFLEDIVDHMPAAPIRRFRVAEARRLLAQLGRKP